LRLCCHSIDQSEKLLAGKVDIDKIDMWITPSRTSLQAIR